MVNGADTGKQQRRDLGIFHFFADCGEVLLIFGCGKPIIYGRASKTVTVSHFNQRYTGLIHGFRDSYHLIYCDLMTLGMHAIAQTHVVDSDFLSL